MLIVFLIFLCSTTLATTIDINQLSLDEKIGQMIVVATVSNPDRNKDFMAICPYNLDPSYVKKLITEYHIGGVLVMGANIPQEQVTFTNALQALSKYPLFIFEDAEWGLSMRNPNTDVIVYPKAMTLGALCAQDNHLLFQCGLAIGNQLRAVGIHSSLSPVCDVNNNPHNPIINTRSFGENPHLVAQKAEKMMRGLQKANTLPCAKHFPGHGNTTVDSHDCLPSIGASQESLNNNELVPFNALIKAGIPAVMIAHLKVPALNPQESNGTPISLSSQAIGQLLRNTMGFDGLIMPDGLGMRGITDGNSEQEIAVNAIRAGHDILLCPVDVIIAIESIKNAVKTGVLTEQEINQHVIRIIRAKESLMIERIIHYDQNKLASRYDQKLKKDLYTAAITLARNDNDKLPLTSNNICVVTIGNPFAPFINTLQQHLPITHYAVAPDATQETYDHVYAKLQHESQIIISVHLPSRSGMIEMHGETLTKIPPAYVAFINRFGNKALLVLFGNPYNLAHIAHSGATIVAYENEPESQEVAALTLVGKHNPRGQLPVTANSDYPAGRSLHY